MIFKFNFFISSNKGAFFIEIEAFSLDLFIFRMFFVSYLKPVIWITVDLWKYKASFRILLYDKIIIEFDVKNPQ